ncbi:MAG: HEAT repeat domain-containing protein, partial [Acidobacteriota bacterium]
ARQALERSARGDACSAVRQAAVETRAALSGPGLEPFLKEALKDADSKVRAAAVKGLSGMKSPRLAPLFEDVFKNDSSYIVQAEALKGIGESGGRDRVPFLRQAAAMPSPRNILQRSAEEAIRKIEGGPGR